MRYVAIALILLTLPAFISLLRQYPHRRACAFLALGVLLFCGDTIRINASVIAWPMWKGLAGGISFSPVDTLGLALLATRPRRAGLGRLPFWGLFAFYMATLVLSIFASSVPMATTFVWWFWLRLLLLFAVVGGECDRPDVRLNLLRGLSLGLMLQAAYVIAQKLSGVVQATGTMYHQNILGMMTEQALLVITGAVLSGAPGRLLKIGVAAGLIVVVGGGSRGAMVMVGGGMVVLALLSLARRPTPVKFKMIGLGALALVVVTPLGLMTMKERFGSHSVVTEETERAAFERAARAMAADHPIGVGASMYVTTANLGGYADRAGVAWNFANRSAPVHNAYLLARAETGWLGQLAYMLMLLVPFVTGLRYAFRNRGDPTGDIILGSCTAFGVLAIHNFYEFAGLTYPVLALALINMAFVASQVRTVQRRARPNSGVRAQADPPSHYPAGRPPHLARRGSAS